MKLCQGVIFVCYQSASSINLLATSLNWSVSSSNCNLFPTTFSPCLIVLAASLLTHWFYFPLTKTNNYFVQIPVMKFAKPARIHIRIIFSEPAQFQTFFLLSWQRKISINQQWISSVLQRRTHKQLVGALACEKYIECISSTVNKTLTKMKWIVFTLNLA